VLADFAKAEQVWLDDLLRGCSDGATALAEGDSGKFGNAVGLRVNPPRSSGGTKPNTAPKSTPTGPRQAPTAKPAPKPQPEMDTRSAFEKLKDKFK
jgi:PTH1 family peptidyl-tRNA hydrolase